LDNNSEPLHHSSAATNAYFNIFIIKFHQNNAIVSFQLISFQEKLINYFLLNLSTGYVLGDVLSFTTMPLCLLMITNLFLAGVIVIHDPPMYLLRKSRFRVWKKNKKVPFFRLFCMKIEGKYFLSRILSQRAEDALKFYRGFRKDVGEMNSKLKAEFDNMTCLIKISNCNSQNKTKITLGDFCKL
jgi:hypothetical protein